MADSMESLGSFEKQDKHGGDKKSKTTKIT